MPVKLTVRRASVYSPCGSLSTIYNFKCPRCQNVVMFFESDRSPLVCKCGAVLADMKNIHNYLSERIHWHYHYMIEQGQKS